jgi:hypothetical protein
LIKFEKVVEKRGIYHLTIETVSGEESYAATAERSSTTLKDLGYGAHRET